MANCPTGYHAMYDDSGTFIGCSPDGNQQGGGNDQGGGKQAPPPFGYHWDPLFPDHLAPNGYHYTKDQTLEKDGSGGSGGSGAAPPFMVTVNGRNLSKLEYQTLVADYKHEAGLFGANITNAEANALAKGDVSASEFQTRLQENQSITDNAAHFDQFKAVLKAQGVAWKGDYADRLQFITGESNPQFYKVWDEYAARASATDAGFSIIGTGKQSTNQDLRMTRGDVLALDKALNVAPDQVSLDQFHPIWAQAATWAMQNLPASRYKGYGLNVTDLAKIAGNVGDATKQANLQRLIGEQAAFLRNQTSDSFQQQQGGGMVDASLQGL